jgi:hypothetical protein
VAVQWDCFHSAGSARFSRARVRRGVSLFAAPSALPDLTRVTRVQFSSAKLSIGDQQARLPHPSHACNSRAVRNLRRRSLVGDSRISDLLRATSSALRDIARLRACATIAIACDWVLRALCVAVARKRQRNFHSASVSDRLHFATLLSD